MSFLRRALLAAASLAAVTKTFSEPAMSTLEQQLQALKRLGLTLNEGVTIDDLLHSFSREEYEKRPFDLLLFVFGVEIEREPWGRPFCSRVWNFDLECITGTGSYERIVRRCCEVAGHSRDHMKELSDFVDLRTGVAWLKYTRPDGVARHWKPKVQDDWAAPKIVAAILGDLETKDRFFYFKDNGQAMVLYFLTPAAAAELNTLSGAALKRVL